MRCNQFHRWGTLSLPQLLKVYALANILITPTAQGRFPREHSLTQLLKVNTLGITLITPETQCRSLGNTIITSATQG